MGEQNWLLPGGSSNGHKLGSSLTFCYSTVQYRALTILTREVGLCCRGSNNSLTNRGDTQSRIFYQKLLPKNCESFFFRMLYWLCFLPASSMVFARICTKSLTKETCTFLVSDSLACATPSIHAPLLRSGLIWTKYSNQCI